MEIQVPTARTRRREAVPPAGHYNGTIVAAEETAEDVLLKWRFRADGRQWTLPQEASAAELADILVDLGLGGQTVTLPDLVGKKGRIEVRTYGGRTSARVTDVLPADSGEM